MPTSRAGEHAATGYTLVELLVVLVLAGMAVTAVAHVAVRQSPGLQLWHDTAAVAAALREARSLAIRDNAERRIFVDPEAHSLRIDRSGRERVLQADLDVSFIAAAGRESRDAGVIYFFPDGSSTGGRVTLSRDGQVNEVAVNWLTGIVEIHENAQ
jgi:general secretion pathway protein H